MGKVLVFVYKQFMDDSNKLLPEAQFRKKLDAYSESFCAAKWYNATIWLGAGQTTSCHHPPSHKISKKAFKKPELLHNTKEKKSDRKLMLKGLRPKGCDYCWRVQDADSDSIPDRVYKSHIYTDKELKEAYNTPVKQDVALKTLEISFDRTCNFACSYCNPGFSTTWVKDIKSKGPYKNLQTAGGIHFRTTSPEYELYNTKEQQNPYVEAFWQWWDKELKNSLQELRITGGEPTMSPELWKLLQRIKDNEAKGELQENFTLAINSNLGMKEALFDKLQQGLSDFPRVEIYTSCEAMGEQAEYIRDGLDFTLWEQRVRQLVSERQLKMMNVMCTVNALCLASLTDFLDLIVSIRSELGSYSHLTFTLNILRFPSFQSCLVFPMEVRKFYQDKLTQWLLKSEEDKVFAHERMHIKRLISYLGQDEHPEQLNMSQDFKRFFNQYDKRRNKKFEETFPEPVLGFYKSIKV